MTPDNMIAAIAVVAILVYLAYAMLRPEKF
jgi:K+-transporting ATPase KdpF subunit